MDEWTVCRICLQTVEGTLKSLPEESYESIPYCNIYFQLVGMTLGDYASFPDKICAECEAEMILAYKFRQKCLETEEKLRVLPEKSVGDEKIEFVAPVEQSSSFEKVKQENEYSFLEKFFHPVKEDNDSSREEMVEDPVPTEVIAVKKESPRKRNRGKIRCKQCRMIFTGMLDFTEHQCFEIAKIEAPVEDVKPGKETSPVVEKRMFKCNECGQTFKMRSMILSHIEKHNKSKKYQCQYCKRRFYKASIRKAHIYRYHFQKTLEYKCPHCPNEYNKSSELRQHIKDSHKEEVSFQCDRCGKNFKTHSILTSHMKIHSDKATCNQCGKELKNQRTLERHMEIHSGQKNYSCPVCSRTFTCNFSVKNHVRKIHPDDVHLLPPDGTVVNKRYLDRMASSSRKRDIKMEQTQEDMDSGGTTSEIHHPSDPDNTSVNTTVNAINTIINFNPIDQ